MKARQYKIKSFSLSKWERVGEVIAAEGFLPIRAEVLDVNKEKASGFVFLQPEMMSSGEVEAESEENEVIVEANLENPNIMIEQATAKNKEEAFSAAKAELEQEYQIKLQELKVIQEAFLASQSAAWKELSAIHEIKCLELSLAISKKILSTAVEIKPDYIQVIIKEALAELSGTKPLKIKVSPQDFEFITVVGLSPELSATELGVVYEIDESVGSGCKIETNYGEVDFVLENMHERIKNNLLEALK